ncbi:MAG: hypothetical protein EAZ55_14815 [Cytophagales bacterium]|nr:MAG: hypothetical protein EAZ55_14815 [Cytophagales bacterium]
MKTSILSLFVAFFMVNSLKAQSFEAALNIFEPIKTSETAWVTTALAKEDIAKDYYPFLKFDTNETFHYKAIGRTDHDTQYTTLYYVLITQPKDMSPSARVYALTVNRNTQQILFGGMLLMVLGEDWASKLAKTTLTSFSDGGKYFICIDPKGDFKIVKRRLDFEAKMYSIE